MKPITLHMPVYGTSLGFSLNESAHFLYFFFKLYFYLRTNISDDHCKGV